MRKEKTRQKRMKEENVLWRLVKWIHKQLNSLVFRVQILKIVVASLFALLLVSIYMVHIIYADDFVAFNALTTTTYLNREVPRGHIYDRHMTPLVRNTSVPVITYRHIPNTYTGAIREVATELAELIEVDHSPLTFRDLQDLFIIEHGEEARALVPSEVAAGLDNAEFHQEMIARITEEHIEELTDEQRAVHYIFTRMYQGAGMTTNIIKENPTDEEIARVTENMLNLPGIEVGVDWSRSHPSDFGNNPILGTITTHQTGIPRERQVYFLSRGYAANARVGNSQIEWAMQSYLSGFQSRYFIEDGVPPTQVTEGLPGFQVVLTLDTEFQEQVEEIVANALIAARGERTSRFVREAYVVVTNPNTGEVLAMVGIEIEPDGEGGYEVIANPLGSFQRSFVVGSTVKGATLMAGYYHGVTYVDQTRRDGILQFQGSAPMSSWSDLGRPSDIAALSRSSNVYFWRQTMDLAGVIYEHGGPVHGWTTNDNPAWNIYRDFFAQVGLGSSTGIELQNEATGFVAQERSFHELLFFAIGQADTYTAMQLAQFAGVIATSGNRMQLQIVQNIYMPGDEGEERQLVRGFEPNLLNQIELTDRQWSNIHEGHRQAVQHNLGTGFNAFNRASFDFNPAGKTGTAESVLHDANGHRIIENGRTITTHNRTFIGYAPWDEPEVAIAVIVPQSEMPEGQHFSSPISEDIARLVLEAYFDLQRERSGN
ncbi:MAG: penicillin-binding transpeptidase domain-containing protein [Turicibacter sp.]|nr:penicillin-binding transpeptidase domain-containing protein [Turicibacter sp.]